jgi:hypothetical protein
VIYADRVVRKLHSLLSADEEKCVGNLDPYTSSLSHMRAVAVDPCISAFMQMEDVSARCSGEVVAAAF